MLFEYVSLANPDLQYATQAANPALCLPIYVWGVLSSAHEPFVIQLFAARIGKNNPLWASLFIEVTERATHVMFLYVYVKACFNTEKIERLFRW